MKIRILFAASSLFLLATLILSHFWNNSSEWRRYQKEYRHLVLSKESVLSVRKVIEGMEIRIHHNFLPELNRIDRCITCHTGMENPKMTNEKAPFRTHSGDILKTHPPERFGCTLCHGGQGLATTMKAAHGDVPYWRFPLREPEQIEAACGLCHLGDDFSAAPRLVSGRGLFKTLGCIGCHRVGKRGRDECPELTRVAIKDFTGDHRVDRKDWQWHREHLLNPSSKVENSIMPNFGLNREEAGVLTLVLNTFTGEHLDQSYIQPAKKDLRPKSETEVGYLEVYQAFGCAACHGPEAQGGRLNPNSQSGGKIPSLIKVKQGYTQQELLQKISRGVRSLKADPVGPDPPYNMPSWKEIISVKELNYLTVFLFSLAPPEEEDDWDDEKWDI